MSRNTITHIIREIFNSSSKPYINVMHQHHIDRNVVISISCLLKRIQEVMVNGMGIVNWACVGANVRTRVHILGRKRSCTPGPRNSLKGDLVSAMRLIVDNAATAVTQNAVAPPFDGGVHATE